VFLCVFDFDDFGRNVTEKLTTQKMLYFPTSSNYIDRQVISIYNSKRVAMLLVGIIAPVISLLL